MMYLIIGRTACGKDYLASELTKQGLKGVISRTTRPRRPDEPDTHIFVTKEQAAQETNRVAYTNINDNDYYVLPQDLEGKQFYIIDPIGAKALAENMPDTSFAIIYVASNDDFARQQHFLEREQSDDQAKYLERHLSEDEEFTDFEMKIKTCDTIEAMELPNNIVRVNLVVNDFQPETLATAASNFAYDYAFNLNLDLLVKEAITHDLLKVNEKGLIAVKRKSDLQTEFVPIYTVTATLFDNPEALRAFMRDMAHKHRITTMPITDE